jgi:hypothetical protein
MWSRGTPSHAARRPDVPGHAARRQRVLRRSDWPNHMLGGKPSRCVVVLRRWGRLCSRGAVSPHRTRCRGSHSSSISCCRCDDGGGRARRLGHHGLRLRSATPASCLSSCLLNHERPHNPASGSCHCGRKISVAVQCRLIRDAGCRNDVWAFPLGCARHHSRTVSAQWANGDASTGAAMRPRFFLLCTRPCGGAGAAANALVLDTALGRYTRTPFCVGSVCPRVMVRCGCRDPQLETCSTAGRERWQQGWRAWRPWFC